MLVFPPRMSRLVCLVSRKSLMWRRTSRLQPLRFSYCPSTNMIKTLLSLCYPSWNIQHSRTWYQPVRFSMILILTTPLSRMMSSSLFHTTMYALTTQWIRMSSSRLGSCVSSLINGFIRATSLWIRSPAKLLRLSSTR
jgi:hypothetical protein